MLKDISVIKLDTVLILGTYTIKRRGLSCGPMDENPTDSYLESLGLLAGPNCFAKARMDYVNLRSSSFLDAQICIDLCSQSDVHVDLWIPFNTLLASIPATPLHEKFAYHHGYCLNTATTYVQTSCTRLLRLSNSEYHQD